MTTMDDRINMRTSDNTAYVRTTSLIAIGKFRNLIHSHGWVSETHKFFNDINETHEMIVYANSRVEREVYSIAV